MIRALNLDSQFIPTVLPEIEFEFLKFNGGEHHIKLNNKIKFEEISKVVITNRFNNSDDIIKVLIAKDALEIKGVKEFELVMPYIPYARQDRQCANGESFSLKVFSNLINAAKFKKVIVFDAHSDVAPALIDNCVNYSNSAFVQFAINDIGKNVILISPDAGANKKINKLASICEGVIDVVKCDKIRDVKNGNLTGFEVFSNNLNKQKCLIVDDIADGGATFLGTAEELKKKNAGDIYLFVTHGIFSKGFEELNKAFKKIYCTNSFKDFENNNIKQFKIQL